MPYQIDWLVENRVIEARYFGSLTLEDILVSADILIEMVNTCDEAVFFIIDSRDITEIPLRFQNALQLLRKLGGNPHIAWTLFVSENALFKYLNIMSSKVLHTPTRTFTTIEEARVFIAHNAPELADELVPSQEMFLVS